MPESPQDMLPGHGKPGARMYPNSPLGEDDARIPSGRDVEWEPLVDYRRNGVSETTIHGAVAWASGGRIIHSFGGNVLCYGRSMMKPLMMKVFAADVADLAAELHQWHIERGLHQAPLPFW